MKKADIVARLPVIFGLDRLEAAAALGISATLFDVMVNDGRMPQPRRIERRKVWDVDELRAAFKSLPRQGEERGNTWADVG